MVITKLYYGANEISRIYKNRVIIWEGAERISLIGYTELRTYTLGTANLTSEVVFAGTAEIDTFGSGVLVPVAIFRLYGEGETNVNGLGDLFAIPVVALEGDGEISVYGMSDIRLLPVVQSGSPSVDLVTYEVGEGVSLPVVNGGYSAVYIPVDVSEGALVALPVVNSGGDTDILIRVKGYGEALNIVQVPIQEGIEIETYQLGDGKVLTIVRGSGESETGVDGDPATLMLLAVLKIEGEGYIATYADGVAQILDAVYGASDAEIDTYAEGDVRDLAVIRTTSEVEIETYAQGNLGIWYEPFIDTDGTLYIRQAYSAQVVDGELEVI